MVTPICQIKGVVKMKSIQAFLLSFAVCAVVFSSPVIARADDELDKWKASLEKREQSLKLQEKSMELDRRAAQLKEKEQAIKEGRWKEDKEGDRRHENYGRAGHCPFWRQILLYLAVIHLMLAVIVFRDVRASDPRMSGMWVAVVLMGGLPATVAYGIFRLVTIKSAGK